MKRDKKLKKRDGELKKRDRELNELDRVEKYQIEIFGLC